MKRENVVTCSPCGENVALATKRGLFNKGTFFTTPHRPYGALPPQGGQLTTHGFTLIELLVVVLIIGILAAVALPQYQLAVDKSRFSAAMPYVKALDEAQQIYYLANGEYSADWNLLDIGFPQGISVDQYNRPRFGQLLLHTNKTYSVGYLLDNNENRYVSYTIYRTKNPMGGVSLYGKSTCLSYGTDNLTRGDKICKAFNGQFITQSTTCGTTIDGEALKCNVYLLE